MKLTKICVTNLFGLFTHPIDIKGNITIIFGPNGFGKTILLKMLDGFFKKDFSTFREVPFDSFSLDFDNGNKLIIEQIRKEKNIQEHPSLKVTHITPTEEPKTLTIIPPQFRSRKIHSRKSYSGYDVLYNYLEEIFPIRRIDYDTVEYLPDDEIYNIEEFVNKFTDEIPEKSRSKISNLIQQTEKWLENIMNSLNIRFIQTQRLLMKSEESRRHFEPRVEFVSTVMGYSDELTKNIKNVLASFGEKSQSLDRTFPFRVVNAVVPKESTKESLLEELDSIEVKRSHLRGLGMLDKDESEFQKPEVLDEHVEKVILVYNKDNKEKLAVFEEIATRLDLFIKIINDHLSYKTVSIDKESGFIFRDINGNIISPTKLSSGEQHELILLYELIFKVKDFSLILIDEPEISLHVAWQTQFLNDIQQISNIRHLDVIIATHSPQIINDRWDLTVELKGPPIVKKT